MALDLITHRSHELSLPTAQFSLTAPPVPQVALSAA